MSLALPGVRETYLRLTSTLGPAPLGVLASLIVLTAVAWGVTLYHALTMSMPTMTAIGGGGHAEEGLHGMTMSGMSAAGWSFSAVIVFLAVWTVMMLAMMLPAIAPMVLIFASAQARRDKPVAVPTWIFVAGYVLVWTAAGLVVYVLAQIGTALLRDLEAWDRGAWGPAALGGTLVVAGLYQFTPAKQICLRHCRSPFAFVAQYWREGRAGALGMGVRHGLYCLGCCWALFAVLAAVGLMSIAWMLLLTLIVFAEKVLPYGQRAATGVGFALVMLGVIVVSGAVSLS